MIAMDMVIRTEASPQIGHGHVMRCLSLATAARARAMSVAFAPRGAYTVELLESLGENPLPQEAGTGARFVVRDFRDGNPEGEVRKEVQAGSIVLLVDEHGSARQTAHLVTDALITPLRREEMPHSPATTYLYGLAYALLRPEFSRLRGCSHAGMHHPKRLMIALGGRDPDGVALRYIKALHQAGFRGPASIVLGEGGVMLQQARQIAADWESSDVFESSTEMAAMMARSDLLVTKIGTTLLEGFCLGLGGLLIEPTVPHLTLQQDLALAYQEWPALELGLADTIDFHDAADRTLTLLQDRERLAAMSQHARDLIDGLGADRIIDALLAIR